MDWTDVAHRQAGVISRSQLAGCGVTPDQIDGLVRRRQLEELLPAVYSPRPVPRSTRQQEWAAVLWSHGALSHRSAARIWQLPCPAAMQSHVTVGDRRFRGLHPNVVLHRVPLRHGELTRADGLPITDRIRTIVDLLRTEPLASGRSLLDRSLQQGWLSERDVMTSLREGPGRTGNRRLRGLLDGLEPGAAAESERLLHRLLRSRGIRGWAAQVPVLLPGGCVYLDVAFPERMLAIEVDGRLWHDEHSGRFEQDRIRQNELVLAGWRVLRFTWQMLRDQPDVVVGRIVQALAA